MEFWSDVLIRITPFPICAEVGQAMPGVYGWLGLCGGYALVMLFGGERSLTVFTALGVTTGFGSPSRSLGLATSSFSLSLSRRSGVGRTWS